MFTGLIETVATVQSRRPAGAAGEVLQLDLGAVCQGVRVGDSVAVNGVCLTATVVDPPQVCFDVSPESLHRSTLGSLRPGDGVNVERALAVGDRLGGHWVLGHVDGTARLERVEPRAAFRTLHFTTAPDLLQLMVPKGSVALDGISLTVAELSDRGFSVAVIPQTLEATTLGRTRVGAILNVEADVLVKTVRRTVEQWLAKSSGAGLTAEQLRRWGY